MPIQFKAYSLIKSTWQAKTGGSQAKSNRNSCFQTNNFRIHIYMYTHKYKFVNTYMYAYIYIHTNWLGD